MTKNYENFKFSGPKSLGNLDPILSSVSQLDTSRFFFNLNPQQLCDISLGLFRHEKCFHLPPWLEVVQEIVTDTLRCINGANCQEKCGVHLRKRCSQQ